MAPTRVDPVAATIAVIEAFGTAATGLGYEEVRRTTVVSRHDPSIRFTNSTISVFKDRIEPGVRRREFLVQPALRLRNLSHVVRTGTMSPFGCYFMAFGAIAPPSAGEELAAMALTMLGEIGVEPDRVRLHAYEGDHDLLDLAERSGATVVPYEEPAPFRHRFGLDAVVGRNVNVAVRNDDGWADVGNIITLERDGRLLGWELAVGTNMVVRQAFGSPHPALCGPGVRAADVGVLDLIGVDALHSALVLAIEGLRPVARGRGGNYRSLLALVRKHVPGDVVASAAQQVCEAEMLVRSSASRPDSDHPGPEADEVVARLLRDLASLPNSR